MTEPSRYTTFWHWFFRGSGEKPGYRRVVNLWLGLHAALGALLAVFVPLPLHDAAKNLLLPLAGTLIGLSFAWAGNAQALMQTRQIRFLAKHHPGKLEEYVYVFQLAILLLLVALVLWGIAGLRVFDDVWPGYDEDLPYVIIKTVLYATCSLAIRSCWHVVQGASLLLLSHSVLSELMDENEKGINPAEDGSER